MQIDPPESVDPSVGSEQVAHPVPPRVTLGDESIGSEAMTEAGMSVGDLPSDFPDGSLGEPGSLIAPPMEDDSSFTEEEFDRSGTSSDSAIDPGASSPGVDPNELYQARRSGTSKSVAMWIVGSLLSVTLLAGLFLWFRQPESTAGLPVADLGPIADTSSEPTDPIQVPDPVVDVIADGNEPTATDDNTLTNGDPKGDPAETVDGDAVSDGVTDPVVPNLTGVPNDLMPRSPLDGPPAVLGRDRPPQGPVAQGPVAQSPTTEPAPDVVTELPPEFAQFQMLLEVPGQAPDAPPMSEAPVLEDVVLDVAAVEFVDPMLIATPPEEVDIETALKMRLAISTKGYPLSDLILFLGEATLIPIQLDWVSMDLAGTDLRQLVATDAKGWTTMGQLLGSAARSAGLKIETEENRLTLTLPMEVLQSKTEKLVELDDFGTERGSAEMLLDQLSAAVDLEPRDALHLRCLTTESLRRMQQRPSLLSDDVMSRWTAAYSHQPTEVLVDDGLPSAWEVLRDGKSGAQLDTAIAMAGLLRRTSRVNGATCVINWTDAQRRRLSPGQLVMAYAGVAGDEVTAGDMLGRTLDPIGLQIREVDPSHWWVGTSATYDRLPVVVRSEPLGPRREDVLHRIRESARLVGVGLAIEHDPVSDGFLAVMPRFLYRQLPKIVGPEL